MSSSSLACPFPLSHCCSCFVCGRKSEGPFSPPPPPTDLTPRWRPPPLRQSKLGRKRRGGAHTFLSLSLMIPPLAAVGRSVQLQQASIGRLLGWTFPSNKNSNHVRTLFYHDVWQLVRCLRRRACQGEKVPPPHIRDVFPPPFLSTSPLFATPSSSFPHPSRTNVSQGTCENVGQGRERKRGKSAGVK